MDRSGLVILHLLGGGTCRVRFAEGMYSLCGEASTPGYCESREGVDELMFGFRLDGKGQYV